MRIFSLCTHSIAGASSPTRYSHKQWRKVKDTAHSILDVCESTSKNFLLQSRKDDGLLTLWQTIALSFAKYWVACFYAHSTFCNKFRAILLYALSVEEYTQLTDVLINYLADYPDAREYFLRLGRRKEQWAKCYRTELMIRCNQTNNYLESQFLVLKDTILRFFSF